MISRIRIVFVKEVIDNLRDRRSVISTLITPLFMPIFMVVLIMVAGKTLITGPSESTLTIPIAGAENAPGLVQFLKDNGVGVIEAPSDYVDQIQKGYLDLTLVIPNGYSEDFSTSQPATVQIFTDRSRQTSLGALDRVNTLLNAYSQEIASLRLLARGVNPAIMNTLAVDSIDLSTPRSQTVIFLNMMPFLMVVVIFTGGMYVVIDTTAGERERGSLEPLLINPVSREDLVLGKLLASIPFAVGTILVALIGFAVAFNVVPLEKYVGVPLSLDFGTLAWIFIISLPLVLLASGLQIVVATFTRSFKEAQTYLALLPLMAGLPGAFLTFLPVKPTVWTMLIPAFGQAVLIDQTMRGEGIATVHLITSALVTLALTLALIRIAIRLYQNERILFTK